MVLIFLGSKFREFYEYQVDREIWVLRKRSFLADDENEYTVIFCEKSKAHFEYIQRMDFFKKVFIIVRIQTAFRYSLILNIALIQATTTYLNKFYRNSVLTKHNVWVCEPRNAILTKVSTRNTQLFGGDEPQNLILTNHNFWTCELRTFTPAKIITAKVMTSSFFFLFLQYRLFH